jgi:DNA primase
MGMIDPTLADEYRMELYRERVASGNLIPIKAQPTPPKIEAVKPAVDSVLDGLFSLATLGEKHPAYKYALKRAIPVEHYTDIYFAPKFFSFAKKYKDSFQKITEDYPRLVFPYFDANGRVYALTARAFGKEEPKYIFVSIDEEATRVYGLNRIDPKKPIIAVEGQIDSLCLDNCIAVGGADYNSQILKSLQSKLIIVPDNDFVRNKQVANSVNKAIDLGFKVSLFPESFRHKDINDAVKAGMTKQQLQEMILLNAKSGAEAKLELIFRRKC